jgi:hypothetical protein
MKKLLFVDHAFHQKTRSADFFVDVIRRDFNVQLYYLDPENQADAGVLAAAEDADFVLLWQMDFLAPVFLAMGKATIVVPMFDGSGEMPDMHWLFASRARFFNFSLRLNERIRMLGMQTFLLRYFPPAVNESELPRFDNLDAFFWQRRPDHGVHINYIDALIGDDIDSLHLHNAPDIAGSFRSKPLRGTSYKFTTSSWFKDKSDYQSLLASSNVFIAPRVAEGIGIALLEAMARGMVVFAHDAPTNNEYISNGVNGILFNKELPPQPVHFRDDAHRLGRMAWQTVVEGHKKWIASHDAICEWIASTSAGPALGIDLEQFFNDLWHSFFASDDEYERFLRRRIGLLEQLTNFSFAKILDMVGLKRLTPTGTAVSSRRFELADDGILDLTLDDQFVGAGWSTPEAEWRWAIGTFSELFFSGAPSFGNRVKAQFNASALSELGKWVHCAIALNGKVVFDGRITPGWKQYEFSFDADLLQDENRLTLVFDKATPIPTDKRNLSVCFKLFQFVPAATEVSSRKVWHRILTLQSA